jgi:hypothetical protein
MSGPHTERPELDQHDPFTPFTESIGWTAPLSSRPLIEHPVAAFLSELADAFADGASGEMFALVWGARGRVAMQLEPEPDQNPLTALRWWAGRLGATSVRIAHRWHDGRDRYSVEESFAAGRLEVWTVARRPDQAGESTSFIPVDQLDRGFDEPPPAPETPSRCRCDHPLLPCRVHGDREEPDTGPTAAHMEAWQRGEETHRGEQEEPDTMTGYQPYPDGMIISEQDKGQVYPPAAGSGGAGVD